jgi:hypothetical protein
VDVVRAYSKRHDLLDDLGRAVRRLRNAEVTDGLDGPISVRSANRFGRKWALTGRLTPDDLREIAECVRAGVPKDAVAKRYGISLSSVQRVVRRQREADYPN